MYKELLKSKIHRATVTEANLNYTGSITIDNALMRKANITEYEKVLVVNVNNGTRFETYVISGSAESGVICLNGAAARLAQVGDIVIIISFALYDNTDLLNYKPNIVFVDGMNKIVGDCC